MKGFLGFIVGVAVISAITKPLRRAAMIEAMAPLVASQQKK